VALEETKTSPVAAASPSPPASAIHSHIAPIYRRCWQQTKGGTQQRLHLLHPLLLSAAAGVTRKKRHITIQFPPKASKPRVHPKMTTTTLSGEKPDNSTQIEKKK